MPRQPQIYETESTGTNTYRVVTAPPTRGALQSLGFGQSSLAKAGTTYLAVGLAFQLLVYGLGSLLSPWFWLHILGWWFFLAMDIVSFTTKAVFLVLILGAVFLGTRFLLSRKTRQRQRNLFKRATGRG